MANQYTLNVIPEQQVYDKNNILYQYNTGTNPLDPLGLHGANYIIDDSQQNVVNAQTVPTLPVNIYTANAEQQILLAQNQAYMNQIGLTQPQVINNNNSAHHQKYQINRNIGMVNPYQVQNQILLNQPIAQPQNINQQFIIQQNLQQNPQIFSHAQKGIQPNQILQNYQYLNHQKQIQQQKKPPIQGQIPQQHHHHQYSAPALINPQQKINLNQNLQQNEKKIINPQVKQQNQINPQNQPQTQIKPQAHNNQNNKLQEQPNAQQKIIPQQNQPQLAQKEMLGINPAQYYYQNFLQNNQIPNQNKINIKYNKNDEHFVNKQIFPERKPIQKPISTANNPNKPLKTLDDTPNLLNGTLAIEKNSNNTKIINNNNIKKLELSNTPHVETMYNKKLNPTHIIPNLSEIKEEEIDINQSGLSKKVSGLNNSDVKESPMEEKKPEMAFPEDFIEDNNINNITQKSITESGISDITEKMDHLPTINSIMKGKSEPLPPSKKKKYK